MKAVLAATILLLAGCSRHQARSLTCPKPESGAVRGSLPESSAEVALGGQRLGRGSENEIAGLAAALRRQHPNASAGAIVNYMVTAYCPVINRRVELDANGKAKALTAFSNRANRIVSASWAAG